MPVSHDKSPIEQALDLAVFGPLGLVLTAKESFPDWVDTGRGRLVHQVAIAKLVGEHAARYGQKVATDTLVGFGILPGPPPPDRRPRAPDADGAAGGAEAGGAEAGGAEAGSAEAGSAEAGGGPGAGRGADDGPASPRVDAEAASPNGRPAGSATVGPVGAAPASGSAELAIPGYDSLSASQVVQRLAGLAAGELEAVRTYEAAGRGRRTILTKISQLQTGRI
jgi:hypothetical protein